MQIKLTLQIKLLFFTLTAFILLPHVAFAQAEQDERPGDFTATRKMLIRK